MNKHFIILTLLLCGISQQTSPLIVTHFSPESIAAQEACIITQDPNTVTQEQVNTCISAMKLYTAAMNKRLTDLLTQYDWLMNHSGKLTQEQIANLKNSKQNLAAHQAFFKTFKMIKSCLANENSLTEGTKDLMTSHKASSIANILAEGEAGLRGLEKMLQEYVAFANNENQH